MVNDSLSFKHVLRLEEAVNWIIDNQLGRRNLTEYQMSYLRGKRYEIADKKPTHKIIDTNGGNTSCSNKRTKAEIAEQTGVSQTTIQNDFKFSKAIDEVPETEPELAQKILTEEVSMNAKQMQKYISSFFL